MDAARSFAGFNRQLASLELTRRRAERLVISGHLPRRDVERVYEGLFLSAITRFEVFVEELFLGLLAGKIAPDSCNAVLRAQFGSAQAARDIVMRGRKYVDWLPYDRTEEIAIAFFEGGRPFTNLGAADKANLRLWLILRHAIAHKSKHAQEQLRKHVIGATPLAPRESTPAGYLRSQYRIAPPRTRFETFLDDIRAVGTAISR